MDLSQRMDGFGYHVVGTAASGQKALTLCAQHRPDLVMMDIVIRGDMDGIETAALIRDRYDIPVIFLTAYSDETTLSRARKTTPYGYLVKPFRTDETRATIEVALYKHRLERQLRQSERWFASTLNCVSDGVVATDPKGLINFVNPPAAKIIGCGLETMAGRTFDDALKILGEKTRQPVDNPIKAALEDTHAGTLQLAGILISDEGKETFIEFGASPITDHDGTLLGAVLLLRDISRRREVECALVESEERFHSAFDFAAIGMALVATDGHFLQTNSANCSILGQTPDEVCHRTLQSFCHADDRAQLEDCLRGLLDDRDRSFHVELRLIKAGSQKAWGSLTVSLVSDAEDFPLYFVIQIQDVTIRRTAEEQLVYFSQFDSLTGMFNRAQISRLLDMTVSQCRRTGQKLVVMFVDVDNFKLVNDTLGHKVGDAVLKEVATRLCGAVRDSDMIGRLGGDEFVLVLNGIDGADSAARIAEKLIAIVQQPIEIEGHDLLVTVSIGISLFPEDATTGDKLVSAADDAMYRAKELGKNCWAYYSRDWGELMANRMQIEAGLRLALEHKQFELLYQPIQDAAGSIISLEALVRWRHPFLGVMSPDSFIPTAERCGLVVPIGAWVLTEACRQLKSWHDAGAPGLRVAVNLSARQFLDPKLVEVVRSALSGCGLDPHCLEVELTESSIMQHPEYVNEILVELRNMGLKVSIDDFGTGYSSLSHLKRFPINTLKIDKSFVTDLPGDRENSAIVSAIVTMSHALDLQVIAEGVETSEQFDLLRSRGCDLFQGFYLCKPLPEEKLRTLLFAK